MKRKLWMVLFASVLVLAACGEEEDDSAAEESTTDDVEETTDEESDSSEEESEEASEDKVEEEEADNDADASEENAEDDQSIVVGEPIHLGDYEMTITNFSLGVDYEGNDALIIDYDWENTSDESTSPFMTFNLKAFQDNVQTDDVLMVDGVDLGTGQKEIKPGGKVEGAQDHVGIDDLDQPLELELEELFSFDDEVFSTTIDLSELE